MQAFPERRQDIKAAKAERINRAAIELIAWSDKHTTT